MVADLHIHSIYSDGSYSPEELIKMGAERGFSTLAIADHDTVEATEEALQAGGEYGVEIIPAIEFSTFRGKAEIHILGYYIDYKAQVLLKQVEEIFSARRERAEKMVELLNEQGVKITFEEVRQLAGDDYIGRPHIARTLVNNGYVKEMGEAFSEKYIGNNGRAYVPKYKITPEEAIELILQVGGIPVLAHPVFINHGQPMDGDDIGELVTYGLKGLEVYHSKQDLEDSRYYKRIAEEYDLLITGGSDFHGDNSPGVELGDIKLDNRYVQELKDLNN